MKEIEAEIGHPVTEELAYWIIRNRTIREAVERMVAAADSKQRLAAGTGAGPAGVYNASRGRIPAHQSVFV